MWRSRPVRPCGGVLVVPDLPSRRHQSNRADTLVPRFDAALSGQARREKSANTPKSLDFDKILLRVICNNKQPEVAIDGSHAAVMRMQQVL
jgi:hypothetical protein